MKNPNVPQKPEKPGGSGSRAASPLAGVIAACALAGSCSSSQPAVRQGRPPLQPCPPGSLETIKKLGIPERFEVVAMPGTSIFDDEEFALVTEGRNEILTNGNYRWRNVPIGTALIGEFIFRDRLYGRFTELRLPDGQRFAFCGALYDDPSAEVGLPWEPGSQPGAMKVPVRAWVNPEYKEH